MNKRYPTGYYKLRVWTIKGTKKAAQQTIEEHYGTREYGATYTRKAGKGSSATWEVKVYTLEENQ